MSIFKSILDKLGIGKKDEAPASSKPASSPSKPSTATFERKSSVGSASGRDFKPSSSKDMPMVDVVSKMADLAKANPEELNWKTSIVDLLKLLGIDSSREARNELAKELGATGKTMEDSARMNTWLHKTVLKKIADNGGNVPKELLD
jgi:hypothetical protein